MGAFTTRFGPLATTQEEEDVDLTKSVAVKDVTRPAPEDKESSSMANALMNSLFSEALSKDEDPLVTAEREYKGLGLGQKLLKGFLVGGIPGAFLGGARKALVNKAIIAQQQKDEQQRLKLAKTNAAIGLMGLLKKEPQEPHELTEWLRATTESVDKGIQAGFIKPEDRLPMMREAFEQKLGIRKADKQPTKLEELIGKLKTIGAPPADIDKAIRIEAGLEPRAEGPLRKIIEDDFGNVTVVSEDGEQVKIGKVSVRPHRSSDEILAELVGSTVDEQVQAFTDNLRTKEDLAKVPAKYRGAVQVRLNQQGKGRVLPTEKQAAALVELQSATNQLDQVMNIALGDLKWDPQIKDFVPIEEGKQKPLVRGRAAGFVEEKFAQLTGGNPEISKFEEVQNTMLSSLVKSVGRDSGNLAEGDIQRAVGFKVLISDTEEEVRWKKAYWRRLLSARAENIRRVAQDENAELPNPHEVAVKYAEQFKPGKFVVGQKIEIP